MYPLFASAPTQRNDPQNQPCWNAPDLESSMMIGSSFSSDTSTAHMCESCSDTTSHEEKNNNNNNNNNNNHKTTGHKHQHR